MTDLVLDVDGLGLVTAVLLLYGHQVTVSRHTQVGPQCQHRLVTRVQSLQNRLVPAEKGIRIFQQERKLYSYRFLGMEMSVAPAVMCITIPRMVCMA